ncbi:hypothetical protein HZS_273 [Henneguya salminicola]|nr:hypothetical protein HZS_273 [Henneguya salminicola]
MAFSSIFLRTTLELNDLITRKSCAFLKANTQKCVVKVAEFDQTNICIKNYLYYCSNYEKKNLLLTSKI